MLKGRSAVRLGVSGIARTPLATSELPDRNIVVWESVPSLPGNRGAPRRRHVAPMPPPPDAIEASPGVVG